MATVKVVAEVDAFSGIGARQRQGSVFLLQSLRVEAKSFICRAQPVMGHGIVGRDPNGFFEDGRGFLVKIAFVHALAHGNVLLAVLGRQL